MRIQEIQRTGSQGPKPKQPPQPRSMQVPAGVKPVQGAPHLGYVWLGGRGQIASAFTGADYMLRLYDLNRKAYIGFLALRSYGGFPLPRSMQVANTQIEDAYRGQGLGQSLYGVALKELGLTIVADETQTPEARRLWANLSRIPGVMVRGWINFNASDVDSERDIFGNAKDNLRRIAKLQGLSKGQTPRPLVMPKDPYGLVYFDFPVQSGAGGDKLQAAENLAAIYTKYHPEDNRRNYDVGLFARWTGQ